jgi:hypothetical protein
MPFFQNVFTSDFEGNWVLGDRHHVPKFVVRQNSGRGDEYVVAWSEGPFVGLDGTDADGTDTRETLEIMYALREPKNWALISVDIMVGADDTSSVTPQEVATALNADTLFGERFQARLENFHDTNDGALSKRVTIRQKKPSTEMRFYVVNGKAEEVLQFNARAGVGEMPSYFARHTIDNRFTYDDCQNHVIALDMTSGIDMDIVNNARDAHGEAMAFDWDGTTEQTDWALLRGKSGLFQFQSGPGTSADSTATTIVYPAGAQAGDLAKKVITILDSSSDVVEMFEMPYTLDGTDLITPP